MGNIGAVDRAVSTDGASDLVKNVSRTVTEASATVKGLTGIDIPSLLNEALGNTGGEDQPPADPGPGHRGQAGAADRAAARSSGGGSSSPTGPGSHRWVRACASGSPSSSAGSAGSGATLATGSAEPAPPRFDTPEAVDAALAAADRAIRAAATPQAPVMDAASGPPRPAVAADRLASADITRATTVDDAARRLALDLRSVPGIERFAAVRLAELERGGPRPLRTMWRVAREQLDERYGALTIGDLIDRYGGPPTPS
jgi:hypothetical protein